MAAKKKSLTKNVPKKNRYATGADVENDEASARQMNSGLGHMYSGYEPGPSLGDTMRADEEKQRQAYAAHATGQSPSSPAAAISTPPARAAIEPPATGGTGRVANVVGSSGGAGTADNPFTYADQSKAPAWARNQVIPSRGTVSGGEDDGSSGSVSGMKLAEQAFARNMRNAGSSAGGVGDRFNGGGVYMMGDSRQSEGDALRAKWDRQGAVDKLARSGLSRAPKYAAELEKDYAMLDQRREESGQRNALGYAGLDNQRYGYDTGARTAREGHAITARGQNIGADTARAGHAIQARGQDLTYQGSRENNADTIAGHLAQADLTGQYGLQGHQITALGTVKAAEARANRPYTSPADLATHKTYLDMYSGKNPMPASPEAQEAMKRHFVMIANDPAYAARFSGQVGGSGGYREDYATGDVVGQSALPDPRLAGINPHEMGAMNQMGDPRLQKLLATADAFKLPDPTMAYKQAIEQRQMQLAGNYMGTGQTATFAAGDEVQAIPIQGQELQGVGPAAGGPTEDSIPAVIDGSKPAALSSGEFVYTAAATESVGAPVLRAIMKGLEQGNPAVIQGLMQVAAKASAPQKAQAAV